MIEELLRGSLMEDGGSQLHLVGYLDLHGVIMGGILYSILLWYVGYKWLASPGATFTLLRLETFWDGFCGGHSL